MKQKDYSKKIKKLLNLAGSSNEYEAKTALLKAKILMAEYKITDIDLENIKNKKVKKVKTRYSCSKRREQWMILLSNVIGENFCCQALRSHEYGKQEHAIWFVGFEEDVDACVIIFDYAVNCIRDGIKKVEKIKRWEHKNILCDSYGFGFAYGVEEAFKQQKKNDGTGFALVMTIPTEVKEATRDIEAKHFYKSMNNYLSGVTYFKGYEDGKKFDPSTKIAGS